MAGVHAARMVRLMYPILYLHKGEGKGKGKGKVDLRIYLQPVRARVQTPSELHAVKRNVTLIRYYLH